MMDEMQHTISVIVPIYKVEAYLSRCVDSIIGQTYHNIEIILVDDGTPDNSGLMADDYALNDDRVVVVHKPNGGLSEARNYGIAVANGDYIGFVDSDDFIAKDMYYQLHNVIIQTGADACECQKVLFYEKGDNPLFDSVGSIKMYEGNSVISALLTDRDITCTVWNKLVNAKIAKLVLFDVGKIHEDILWTYRAYSKCKRVSTISHKLYAYFQREGSIMNSSFTAKRYDALDALRERAIEVKHNQPELYPRAERSYAGGCMHRYQYLCRQKKTEEYERFKKELHKRFVESDRKAVMKTVDFKYKLWYTLFLLFPELTCCIRNQLKIGC